MGKHSTVLITFRLTPFGFLAWQYFTAITEREMASERNNSNQSIFSVCEIFIYCGASI